MNARVWVLSASLLLGCLPAAEPYRCDLAGGDRACDSVPGGRCAAGYCAEPVSISLCASGLRYTATARRPGECVSADDAAMPDVTDAVADLSAPPDQFAAVDAPDVSPAQDLSPPTDLVTVDLSPPADATAAIDAVDAMDASDVVTPMDASDAVTPMDAMDVVAPMDAMDVVAVRDAGDAPDVRDAPDVVDAPDVRDAPDVVDVVDAPDVSVVSPPVDWISPLPNERFLSARIPVRVQYRGTLIVSVRTALGMNCDRAQTVTRIFGNNVDVTAGREYLCLRIEVGADGSVWTSPWRHIVSMGRVYDNGAAPHWGRWPDFNNDGRADLLMATASAVRVFRFASNGAISDGGPVSGPSFSARAVAVAAVGDVDGDSFGDAVITWDAIPGREVFIHRGGPGGLQGPGVRIGVSGTGPNLDLSLGQRIFPIGDRGSDGRTNFGVSAFGGLQVRTFGLDPQGRVMEGPAYIASDPIDAFVSDADADGDGVPDAAFHTGTTTYLSLSSLRDNILISPEPNDSADFGRVLAFGSDLDNDGRSDLAVLAPGSSRAVVYRWANNTLGVVTRVDLPTADPAALVMPGDSGDDLADDLWAFTSTNRARLRRGGYSLDVDGALPWRDSLGVILAGVADNDTRGRVWGGSPRDLTPNGFSVYTYDGARLTSQTVPDTNFGPVTAVAP